MGTMKVSRHALTIALIQAHGDVTAAAKAVGLDRTTVFQRLKRDQKMREAVDESVAYVLQQAVANVSRAVEDGDLITSRWILERKGRHLGYGNTVGLRLTDKDIDALLSKMDEGQLRTLAEGD